MQQRSFLVLFEAYDTADELASADADLLAQATQALKQAYPPYSEFYVGAAVRLESGRVVIGNNQENAAYPFALCAERVALFAAQSAYPHDRVMAIAVAAHNPKLTTSVAISPCGGCRQVLAEHEHRHRAPIRIILQREAGAVWVFDQVSDLLPFGFEAKWLG